MVARIAPDGRLTSPWYPYQPPGGAREVCATLLCFDNFESDLSGVPGECYAPDCGQGAARWMFGTSYEPNLTVNDLKMGCTGCSGQLAERVQFAFHASPCPELGGRTTLLVAIFTYEDFQECADPPYGGTYSGILYEFADIECNPAGYYWADVPNLCDYGLFHPLPRDGQGAYSMIISPSAPPCDFFPCGAGQPMLWGTKHPSNPDAQGPRQYEDANRDARHDFRDEALGGECFDRAFGLCPDPLGAMVAFFGSSGDAVGHAPCSNVCVEAACCACDANCDGSVDAFDIDALVARLLGGLGCSDCAGDTNGDGAVDGFDIEPFVAALEGSAGCGAGCR